MDGKWNLFGRSIRAIAIAVAAYLSFWAIATLVELAAQPIQFGSHAAVRFLPLDRNGDSVPGLGPQIAQYQKPYRFVSRLPDLRAQRGKTELRFAWSGGDTALLLARRADVLAVRLNGAELLPDAREARLAGTFISEPVLYRFPLAALKPGDNRVEIEIRRSLRDPFLFPDFAIAPTGQLLAAYHFRSTMIIEASVIGLALMVLIILLCLFVAWPDAERAKMRAFIATLTCSAAIGALILFVDVGKVGLPAYAIAHSVLAVAMGLAALFYGVRDGASGPAWPARRIGGIVAAILAVSIVLLMQNYTGLPGRLLLLGPSILAMLFVAFALVCAAAMLIWRSVVEGWSYLAERYALIVWFGAVAFDRGEAGLFTLSSPFAPGVPLSLHWLPILGTFVGLAMLVVLARQASEARATIFEANERLTAQLAEREAELRRSYQEREILLERHATQNERQRIMRDMHDGLGSQLISMLLAARRGEAHPAQVADGLQAVIDEMRLMIDSMDSVGDSLGSALAIFRQRIAPRIASAGVALNWRDESAGAYPQFEPRELLQVFRIMQEAVANALKHAEAGVLDIAIGPSPEDGFSLRISISDDGCGMESHQRPGKGMASMRSRAASIGARIEIANAARGVAVLLDLPE